MTVMDERTVAAIYRLADEYGWRFEAKKDSLRQTQDSLWKLGLTVADLPRDVAMAPAGTRYFIVALPPLEEIADRPASPPAEQAAPPRERMQQDKPEQSDADRAVTRAAILCNDWKFIRWYGCADAQQATEKLRAALGGSRKNIAADAWFYEAFIKIETDFRMDSGLMAARR